MFSMVSTQRGSKTFSLQRSSQNATSSSGATVFAKCDNGKCTKKCGYFCRFSALVSIGDKLTPRYCRIIRQYRLGRNGRSKTGSPDCANTDSRKIKTTQPRTNLSITPPEVLRSAPSRRVSFEMRPLLLLIFEQ